jgi:CCR4-NOT transcriptional regulation complex NOT5 subunit
MTLDITLCGSWAGTASVLEETCEALQGDATCYTTYVINDQQSTYANAYFEINYINVYSSSSSSSASSSSSSTTSAATVRKDLLGYGAVAGIVAVTAALVI